MASTARIDKAIFAGRMRPATSSLWMDSWIGIGWWMIAKGQSVAFQLIFSELAIESTAADAQLFGGDCAASVTLFQGADDQFFFGVLHGQAGHANGRGGRSGNRLAQSGGQIASTNSFASAKHDRMLDRRAQFADIAGPGIANHQVHGLGGEPFQGLAHFLGKLLEEGMGELGYVPGPFA